MFKIGLFTFGGGYAMVAIIESELVDKKKWITKEEFLDIIAIAESSPGPIAINSATYVGYKVGGFLGSLFCTLGVVMPSFIIIFIISFFYERFLALEYVKYAFMGIQVCVAYLITFAGIKMLKSVKNNVFSIILTVLTVGCMLVLNFLSKNISSIYYILIGGLVGITAYICKLIKKRTKIKSAANDAKCQTISKSEPTSEQCLLSDKKTAESTSEQDVCIDKANTESINKQDVCVDKATTDKKVDEIEEDD